MHSSYLSPLGLYLGQTGLNDLLVRNTSSPWEEAVRQTYGSGIIAPLSITDVLTKTGPLSAYVEKSLHTLYRISQSVIPMTAIFLPFLLPARLLHGTRPARGWRLIGYTAHGPLAVGG